MPANPVTPKPVVYLSRSRTVIDRGCKIPDGMVIGEDAELDAKRFHRSANGICLVTRDMLAKLAA